MTLNKKRMKAIFIGKDGSSGLVFGKSYEVEPYGFSTNYIVWLSERRATTLEIYSGVKRTDTFSVVPMKRFCDVQEWRKRLIEELGL